MACQKTVVDLTLMSDAEIIHYFSKVSGSVCGRVGSDQLNRKLEVPRPPRKSPWMGWPVLLSGLLFTSDEAGSHHAKKPDLHQCEKRPVSTDLEGVTLGTMAVMRLDTPVLVQEAPDNMVYTGEIVAIEPSVDTVVGVMGDMVVEPVPVDTAGVAIDSVTMRRALAGLSRNIVDTVKQIVADSLKVVGIRVPGAADPGEMRSEPAGLKTEPAEVTVYPNPVVKGASLNLSWKKEAVDGRVNLYSMSGALIQSWMIQGGCTMRTLTMPADIAAGVYVLQVQTKDGAYTLKVVVE
jgi:hypothetical protein